MIEMLYYPKTPYLFNIIEPSVLGKIYESFLAESLTISGGEVLLAKKNDIKIDLLLVPQLKLLNIW